MSHREKEWTEDYKTKQWQSRRHRRCIEQRSLFAHFLVTLCPKHLPQKSYQEYVRYPSVTLCAVGTSVTQHKLCPLRDSVCPLYKPFSLSLHISKEPLITLYHVSHYPVPCLPLLCYHVSHYSVTMSLITLLPCLLLLCLMSPITLLPCLLLLCLMPSITLLPCLLLPCPHQGMQNHKKELTS